MRLVSFLLLPFIALSVHATEPWKLNLSNSDEGVNLRIDLHEESITVPGMEMFGPMNGYLNGKGVYGVWSVTSFDIKSEKVAILRLSNDLGSETQSIRLSFQNDSTYLMELQDGVVVKRTVNRKLVKIPAKILMKR